MVEKLASSPYDVLTDQNQADIKTILNSVKSGIESGSVSVKDIEKSKQAIDYIDNLIPELIKKKTIFLTKQTELNNQLEIFDNNRLLKLINNLEKSRSNISDAKTKIISIENQINSSHSSIHDMISKLELNLKQASSISYKVLHTENDLQN